MLISLTHLLTKYDLNPQGILHLGAHIGQETKVYQENNIHNVIWIEGNEKVYKKLISNLNKVKGNKFYNILISDIDNVELEYHLTNNEESSSILELKDHKIFHPKVIHTETILQKARRLDIYFKENQIDISSFDFLNIDLQGAELIALESLGEYLSNFKYIYLEVNTGSLYKDCPKLSFIDKYLGEKGFIRKVMKLTKHGWGDAFYIKEDFDHSTLLYNVAEAKKQERYFKYKKLLAQVKAPIKRLFSN